jgi:selenocysteine lyase/cysteine desulfurase
MNANSRNRAALFSGASGPSRGPNGAAAGNIYDDEAAKTIEAHNNALQADLHAKIQQLKGVRLALGVCPTL